MLLNFYYPLLNLLTLLNCFNPLVYTLFYKLAYTNTSDLLYRIYIDDFFLNNFYYLWTVFRYIPFLVLTLLVTYLLFTALESLNVLLLVFAIWLTYYLYIGDFWSLLDVSYLDCVDPYGVNALLLNSINKYHPFIFYLALVLTYTIFLNSFRVLLLGRGYLYVTNSIRLSFYCFSYFHLHTITNALFLGSWWAVQEGSWGGWWNWDPSEVFGLVVLVVSLIFIHSKLLLMSPNYATRLYKFLASALLSVYLFIQLNFNLISHNFNLVGDSNLYFFMLFLLLFMFSVSRAAYFTCFYATTVLLFRGLYNTPCQVYRVVTSYSYGLTLLINTLTLLIILISFRDLINGFTFLLLSAELLNTYSGLNLLVLYLTVLVAISSWHFSVLGVLTYTLVYLYTGLWPLILLVLGTHQLSYLNLAHTTLYIHLIINTLVVGWVTTSWRGYGSTPVVDMQLLTEFYLYNTFTALTGTLEYSYVVFKDSFLLETPTMFFVGTSTPGTNLFNLTSSLGLTVQRLFIGNTFIVLVIEVADHTLLSLATVYFLVYLLTAYRTGRSELITF